MRKLALWLLPLAAGIVAAHAAAPAPVDTANVLSSVDYNFVAQANLGAPFRSIPVVSPNRRASRPPSATMHI